MRPLYFDNDVGPFASYQHILRHRGPGPQEVDLDIRDRDVVLNIRVDNYTFHLLHLQNVRADTVAAAQSAVDDFLNQLKAIDDANATHPMREAHTMHESFDQIHEGFRKYLEAQAEERGLLFDWDNGGFPRQSLRPAYSQPKYQLRFFKDASWEWITGSRSVSPWSVRVLPNEEESHGNLNIIGSKSEGQQSEEQ